MRTAKTPIRLGRSESSLGAQSDCWFCHVVAQIKFSVGNSNDHESIPSNDISHPKHQKGTERMHELLSSRTIQHVQEPRGKLDFSYKANRLA